MLSIVSEVAEKRGATSDAARVLSAQIFQPAEWDEPLVEGMAKLLAPLIVQGAAAELLLHKVAKALRDARAGVKRSSASDAVDLYGIDVPSGIGTEMPAWLAAAVRASLDETFRQPYWQEINQTTATDIARILDQGMRDGLSIPRLAKLITAAAPEYGRFRGRNVARTETSGALNSGHEIGIAQLEKDLGESVGKEWLSVLGVTTRVTHADLDGVQVATADGMFNLAGYEVPYPAHHSLPPGERCNCQCTILSVLITEEALRDEDDKPKPQPGTEVPEEVIEPAAEEATEEEAAAPAFQVPAGLNPTESLFYTIENHPELNEILVTLSKKAEEAKQEHEAAKKHAIKIWKLNQDQAVDTQRKFELGYELIDAIANNNTTEEERIKKELQETKDRIKNREKEIENLTTLRDEHRNKARIIGYEALSVPKDERVEVDREYHVPPAGHTTWESTGNWTGQHKGNIEEAHQRVDSWLRKTPSGPDEISVSHNAMALVDNKGKATRAQAIGKQGIVKTNSDDPPAVVAHELGHVIENQIPGAKEAAGRFVAERIAQAGTQDVNMKHQFPMSNYDASEKGNEDNFQKSFSVKSLDYAFYAGKQYKNGQTEIISMGVEELYRDPVGFAQRDPEYFKFIVGILRGVIP